MRGSAALLWLLLLLAVAGPAAAQSSSYDFTVSPDPPTVGQVTTFRMTTSPRGVDVEWDLNGNGFYESEGRTVTRTYSDRGPVTVRMRVRDDDDDDVLRVVTKTIVVNGPPSVDYTFAPASPLEGEAVGFAATSGDAEGDAVTLSWDFGDGGTDSGASPSHAFSAPGTYTVVVTARDEHGLTTTRSQSVTVRPDPGPVAAFDFSPAAPLTGETVTFTSSSTPSQGTLTRHDWDFDGDGAFDDARGEQVTWVFDQPGTHRVLLRVRQANGRQAVAFSDVTVAAAPPPPQEPPADPAPADPGTGDPQPLTPLAPVVPERPAARRLRAMRPLPIVRIAGYVVPNGARVQILSVRVPLGARVRLRCRGEGCPKGVVARTSATRLLRFHRFERRLRAGITLEVFIRKPGFLGKYTRFRIRAGDPPARVDRCLFPGQARPRQCP